jgi:hypothetical protein
MCRYILNRRGFLRKSSLAGTAAIAATLSLEEKILLAAQEEKVELPTGQISGLPAGKIGNVTLSRLICGGNLIGGYAHSRDLVYVSDLLKAYFTEDKILDTFEKCEENGINTAVLFTGATRHIDPVKLLQRYWDERGGKMQFLAQVFPKEDDLYGNVKLAIDCGAVGAFVLGNVSDAWVRAGKTEELAKVVSFIKENGLIGGIAAHNISVPIECEKQGVDPDFYMKTLHSNNYWSKKRPEQTKDVIDNYSVDNYWDKTPDQTVSFMQTVKKPWIGYKVLAAGALRPMEGFTYAFEKGADILCVGMYDFQIQEDVVVTKKILAGKLNRQRPWMA